MIALGTIALLNNPDQIPHLLAGPDQVASAVEELLRYLSIVHGGLRRTAIDDVTIGGVTIHAGEGVIIPVNVANRDPEFFTDPDDLDLARANVRQHLAFGYGIHQCLGQPLARAELQIVLPEVFRRLPSLRSPYRSRRSPSSRPPPSTASANCPSPGDRTPGPDAPTCEPATTDGPPTERRIRPREKTKCT